MSLWRDGLTAFALLAVLGLMAARLNGNGEAEHRFSGPFHVIDGDTLAVGGERLRLLGIDAPEIHQTCQRDSRDWPCGETARDALLALVNAAPVDCVSRARDRYHRPLVTCQAGETPINAAMVLNGMAVAYGDYRTEEQTARTAGTGLWAGTFTRPADWRKTHGIGAQDSLGGDIIDRLRHTFGL